MTFGVSTGLYNDLEIEEAVGHLAEIGWTNIEYGVVHVANAVKGGGMKRLKALRSRCRDLGVKAWQMHAPDFNRGDAIRKKENRENACRWLDYCAVLEVTNLVMHPGGSRLDVSLDAKQESLDLNAEAFREIGAHGREVGVQVAIENLFNHSILAISDLNEIIRRADAPSLGICIDTSHLNILGLDIPAAIHEAGDKLWATHLSDNDGSGDQHRIPYNAPYWSGKAIDWTKVVPAYRKVGYRGLLNLEILGEGVRMVERNGTWVPEGFPPIAVRDMKLDHAAKIMRWLLDGAEAGGVDAGGASAGGTDRP